MTFFQLKILFLVFRVGQILRELLDLRNQSFKSVQIRLLFFFLKIVTFLRPFHQYAVWTHLLALSVLRITKCQTILGRVADVVTGIP